MAELKAYKNKQGWQIEIPVGTCLHTISIARAILLIADIQDTLKGIAEKNIERNLKDD